jgi:hypothetical protein
MANLSKTKTLFAFTSPRTLEKIIPELRLLIDNFKGQVWNTESQIKFFKVLFDSPFYMGEKMPSNISLAARDRITRAPKALGFVDLKPKIEITQAGQELLKEKRIGDVFTRQLMKFQFPSPYHKLPEDKFCIKPYLEFLHLLKAVGSLSKTEIALFFLQHIHIDDFKGTVKKIIDYRAGAKKFKGSRKIYAYQQFEEEIKRVYHEDIAAKDLKTRESSDATLQKFIKTKRSNWIDYADAFIRYLRATELITFQEKTLRVVISPAKSKEVNHLLKTIDRKPIKFDSIAKFKAYLFSSSNIVLYYDIRENLIKELEKLKFDYDATLPIEQLKDLLEIGIETTKVEKIKEAEKELKDFKEYDDIVSIFEKLQKRDVPDPPLYLEWNVWRAMVMLNYAQSVTGNFKIDLDGVPLSTAGGNMPDIEIEYDDFKLIVEVTMSRGNTQFKMESESVPRHFGKTKEGTDKDVYCLFIAPKISEGALAHFFNLNRFKTKLYGGKTRIVPIDLSQFLYFIEIAKEKNLSSSQPIKEYLNTAIKSNLSADDEEVWQNQINDLIPNWVA